jgi:uncharacterized protein (DUF433 family)
MVADGLTHDEILAAHPDLEAENIREALQHAGVVGGEAPGVWGEG